MIAKITLRKAAFVALATGLVWSIAACSGWRAIESDQDQTGRLSHSDLTRFSSSVRFDRQDCELLYQQACLLMDNKKYRLAITVLEDVVRLEPGHVRACNAMGVSYDHLGEFSSAARCYQTVLKVDSSLHFVWNNLGYSYLLQDQIDAAIEAFKQAVLLDEQNPKYHNNLALAYAEKQEYDLAFEQFVAGGGRSRAYYNLAKICFRHGQYQKAAVYFSSVLGFEAEKSQPSAADLASSTPANVCAENPAASQGSATRNYLVSYDESGKKIVSMKIDHDQSQAAGEKVLSRDASTARPPQPGSEVGMTQQPAQSQSAITDSKQSRQLYAGYGYPDYGRKPVSDKTQADLRESLRTDEVIQDGGAPVGVEVSNGNGTDRMAARVGQYLQTKGHSVLRVCNADHFNYPETIIFYRRGYLRDAYQIAKQIPGYQNMKSVEALGTEGLKIRILIGKDLVRHDDLF